MTSDTDFITKLLVAACLILTIAALGINIYLTASRPVVWHGAGLDVRVPEHSGEWKCFKQTPVTTHCVAVHPRMMPASGG